MTDIEKLLFVFFFAFVLIHCFIYFAVYLHFKEKLYKDLSYYWLLVFSAVFLEGFITEGRLGLSLIFSLNLLPLLLFTFFLVRTLKAPFNYKIFLGIMLLAMGLSVWFDYLDYSFTIVSLPVSIACCLPAVYYSLLIIYKKDEVDFFQKTIAYLVNPLIIICCIHYSLYRPEGDVLIGFGTAFLTYIIIASILPLYALRQINIAKNSELEATLQAQTAQLVDSKNHKEKLLRVLVHDLANGLQSIILQNTRIQNHPDHLVKNVSASISKNIDSIIQITSHVKRYEANKSEALALEAVDVAACLSDLKSLFFERFKHKNIELIINNSVPNSSFLYVDKITFIHSVMANLMSNALKFSYSDSKVHLNVYEENEKIVFDLEDFGIGMEKSILETIIDPQHTVVSSPGTCGEMGTGFGLPLVKSYVDVFEGELLIISSMADTNTGTRVLVTLPRLEEEITV